MSPSFWEFSPNHAQVIKFLEFSGLGVTESSTEKGEKEKENHVMFRRPKIQEAVSSNRTAPSSGSLQPPMGVFLPRQTPPPGWGLGSLYPYWTSCLTPAALTANQKRPQPLEAHAGKTRTPGNSRSTMMSHRTI
jgi:hypothetical protein